MELILRDAFAALLEKHGDAHIHWKSFGETASPPTEQAARKTM
jgi:hypothetical protein